ncbi:MAG TPA: LysR family transcriptional regulator, partial [Pseudomonas sp.]|nr:LysR family transcriptional regulator [Pseudomonas sp.]
MSRDLPPLNALRAFEAAARLQSVSKAGEELHVTHGAISRQIRALEEQLGVSLFHKEGRGVKLTDAGQRLRDVASESFERLSSVCADLRRQQAERPFVLGCPGSLLAR